MSEEIKPVYITGNMESAVVKSNMPIRYRLARKPNGDYILQAQFHYSNGFNKSWTEFENLPTLEISDE